MAKNGRLQMASDHNYVVLFATYSTNNYTRGLHVGKFRGSWKWFKDAMNAVMTEVRRMVRVATEAALQHPCNRKEMDAAMAEHVSRLSDDEVLLAYDGEETVFMVYDDNEQEVRNE